jgi:hypothetical protein
MTNSTAAHNTCVHWVSNYWVATGSVTTLYSSTRTIVSCSATHAAGNHIPYFIGMLDESATTASGVK